MDYIDIWVVGRGDWPEGIPILGWKSDFDVKTKVIWDCLSWVWFSEIDLDYLRRVWTSIIPTQIQYCDI